MEMEHGDVMKGVDESKAGDDMKGVGEIMKMKALMKSTEVVTFTE